MSRVASRAEDRRQDAARYLTKHGITTGLTRHSGRFSNLKKLDRAARISNGARPLDARPKWHPTKGFAGMSPDEILEAKEAA